METRLESCLQSLKINTNSVEKFINDLTCILIDNCSTEIDSAIQRFLLRSRSGIQIQTPRNDGNYVLRSIVDAIIFEPGFKVLRSRFFKVCLRFRPPLSRSSSSDLRYVSNSASSDETVLGLSTFSFGYSLRPAAINNLNLQLSLLIDPNVDIKLRLESLETFLTLSPMILTLNMDLSMLIEEIGLVLCEPKLFTHTVQLLCRLLQTKDEQLWKKIIKQLVVHSQPFLDSNSISTISKFQFVDFMLQLIGDSFHIYRHFSLDIQTNIIKAFSSLLEAKSEFVQYSIAIDPSVSWLRSCLHSFSHRKIFSPSLISLVSYYINEKTLGPNYQVNCFQFCFIVQVIQYKDILTRLDPLKISSYLAQLLGIIFKKKKIRRTCSLLLLEASMNQTSATFFSMHSFDILTKLRQSLSIKLCYNVLKHSTLFANRSDALIELINVGLTSQNPSILQHSIDLIDVLIGKNWIHLVRDGLNSDKLVQHLDPKVSNQHARIMLALEMTENQQIWTDSFKNFIRNQWLTFIQHPIRVITVEERHYMSRLITKFLTIGEEYVDEVANKREILPLFWMVITQPRLIDSLIDPFSLNIQLTEQFNKISQNQQTEFLQRLLMLVSNLDILTVLRRHFQLANKLSQIAQTFNNDNLIMDKRLIVLVEILKRWYIAGPNERFQSNLQKFTDLRQLINRPVFKRQNELRAPSMDFKVTQKSVWLKNYLNSERSEDYSIFLSKFIASLEKKENSAKMNLNLTKIMPEEWLNLIVDYAFGIGVISSKRATRSLLSTLSLLECVNERNHWFLALLLLITRFDSDQTAKLIDYVLYSDDLELIWPKKNADRMEFFEMTKILVMPHVKRLLRPLTFQRLMNSNLPIFHLLLHYSHINYLGLLDFSELLDYFVLQLIFGHKFQALFFVGVLEHLCANTTDTPIPLRHFFHSDLSNLSFAKALTPNIELLFNE